MAAEVITVEPRSYVNVEFDADVLAGLAAEALARVPEVDPGVGVAVNIDENAATTTFRITSLDPLIFDVDSGAVENLKDPRRVGNEHAAVTFTRLFLEVADRRAAWFGAPELDADLSQAHATAWDVNLHGRVAGRGLRQHQPRYRYNFRNRHGFSDRADEVFEQLWSAGEIPWSRIVELSDSAQV
ncbi:MAG: hypothetical protein AAF962_23345 [Actinomycetota bacterium]